MVKAKRNGIPFWPAPSILDMPAIIAVWQSIAAEGEAKARPTLERKAAEAKR